MDQGPSLVQIIIPTHRRYFLSSFIEFGPPRCGLKVNVEGRRTMDRQWSTTHSSSPVPLWPGWAKKFTHSCSYYLILHFNFEVKASVLFLKVFSINKVPGFSFLDVILYSKFDKKQHLELHKSLLCMKIKYDILNVKGNAIQLLVPGQKTRPGVSFAIYWSPFH